MPRSMASESDKVKHLLPKGPSGSSSMLATSSPGEPASSSSPSCHMRGVAVMYSRRSEGMRVLSWMTAHGFPIRPETRCASSPTMRSQAAKPPACARSNVPSPRLAYVAYTVTLSRPRVHSTSSSTSVVLGKDTSSPRREDTPSIGPRRPPSRHAASVWASRSREGTRTSTRSAWSSSALRTATWVFPDPVAMITWVRSPRSGMVDRAGSPRARDTASTASPWCGRSCLMSLCPSSLGEGDRQVSRGRGSRAEPCYLISMR